ncbi:phasin family protein [Bosea sp. OK403]|uniref:phasin family protein n=1 Tax=Bosea sp. OK403 TaxID=1855286 RepID=UPI0011143D70|nr:phasin family protein [Bosea sp. OK403]
MLPPSEAAQGARLGRRQAMTNPRSPQGHNGASPSGMQPFGSFEDLSKSMQGQFAAISAIPHAMLEAQLAMGSELFGFMGRRMKAQAELCHELSQCRELADAVQAQRRFSERVSSDYSEEFGQITTMLRNELTSVADAASEAVTEASKAAKLAA